MALRRKWLRAHPLPPQDEQPKFTPKEMFFKDDNSRRRPTPIYDIFAKPIPDFTSLPKVRFAMEKGVINVYPEHGLEGIDTTISKSFYSVAPFEEFVTDYNFVSYLSFRSYLPRVITVLRSS
jgi:hypothetical protein